MEDQDYNSLVSNEYAGRRAEVRENLGPWIRDAHEDLAFAAGQQWDAATLEQMRIQKRPALTFNQIAPQVDAVTGNEITNRFEPHYLPRTVNSPQPGQQQGPMSMLPGMNDQPVVDVVGQVVKYYRDKSQAGHEESQSFRQAAICGVGCAETTFDVTKDPRGALVTRHVCIKEMAWDPTAKSQNLQDAQWVMRYRWVPRATAEHIYGKELVDNIGAKEDSPEAIGASQPTNHSNRDIAWMYTSNSHFFNRDRNQVLVTEYQWIEQEPVWLLRGASEGPRTLTEEEYASLQQNMEAAAQAGQPLPYQVERATRPCVYQAFFIGDTMVRAPEKLLTEGRFTFRFITGFRDESGDYTYWRGIVYRVKDPQRWANVFLSSMVATVAHNPKGTALVPKGAFSNISEAKSNWAAQGAMIEVDNPGAMDRIKIISQPHLPPASHDLVQLCWSVIPQLTGVSPYMTGGVDDVRRAPSSSIQAMQQAGMTVLSPLFDGLSRYKKSVGELYLALIRNYLDDGVVIRVVDQPSAQYARFSKDQMAHEYDVVVHENQTSPSAKANVWKTLTDQGFVQMIMQMYGRLPGSIWDMMPDAPESFRNDMRMLDQQQQQQAQAQQQQGAQAAPPAAA